MTTDETRRISECKELAARWTELATMLLQEERRNLDAGATPRQTRMLREQAHYCLTWAAIVEPPKPIVIYPDGRMEWAEDVNGEFVGPQCTCHQPTRFGYCPVHEKDR